MKKRNKIIMTLIFWIIIVLILYSMGLLTTDFNKINLIIGDNPIKMRFLFVLFSTVRIAFFIPQTIFTIGGSMVFGPYEGFFLSILSLVISHSILYAIGIFFEKQLLGEGFFEKNKENITVLSKHGYKVLALGVACPVTPSDFMTILAACIKLNYKKSILTVLIASAPMTFLYGFLGNGFKETAIFRIFVAIVIVLVSYYTFRIWNKIKKS
ncbi:TVP38/TMEM64 family protein [Inconstantimicrobium mannanitabidum]|uniref:TVP38/TMEM64 family protein n=1 Tax=Inconstantimicrobium mannanitabidum TaxID=1604901 RepID=A0ACB5R8E3_9CLOT|nr:VTT domain-containing protein [Clostridium sp. TW13]GKX65236.1 TVP38/TMEM64 family protein [Clostridium sp. TW13]